MSRKLTDLCGEQAQCGGRMGRRGASCVLRELAAYKRSSVRALMVSVPMASAHSCRGRRPRLSALFQNERCRGVSLEESSGVDRS
jgi:hypothetical protein